MIKVKNPLSSDKNPQKNTVHVVSNESRLNMCCVQWQPRLYTVGEKGAELTGSTLSTVVVDLN